MFGQPTGLSSQAIAHGGTDHPWDPSDLNRCMTYCAQNGISTNVLRDRMQGRSVEWDRLLPEWGRLTGLLRHEIATRSDNLAPLTYSEMKRVLADGIRCATCAGTGRGDECAKCKGSGRRKGGQCRAQRCYLGADLCRTCRGNGYVPREKGA